MPNARLRADRRNVKPFPTPFTKMQHRPGCRMMLAATCAVAVACPHGFDACPACDPCTCDAERAAVHAIIVHFHNA